MLKIILTIVAAVSVALMDCNPSLYLFDQLSPSAGDHYKGKTVWITGASSGIGAELAVQLSMAGASLIISARREGELKKIKELCPKSADVKLIVLDVTDSADVLSATVDEALKHFGGRGLDILMLNAGRSQRQPALDSGMEVTRDLMKLNFESYVELAMLVIKKDRWVEKEQGHIVVTSSLAGKLPVALSSSYAASKWALHGYFNSLRSELDWLRVDLICPGPIATPIASKAHSTEAAKAILASETMESKMPVDRFVRLMLAGVRGPRAVFYETWISPQPELTFTALGQYLPTFTTALANVMGPKRIEAFNSGKNIFKSSSWMTSGAEKAK